MKSRIVFFILFLIFLSGCKEKKIEITSEYIIDEYWDKQDYPGLEIDRMKLKKDSVINPFSDLPQTKILSKLEEDSSFRWEINLYPNKGQKFKDKKIYFNMDNGSDWYRRPEIKMPEIRKVRTIGNLNKNTWYKFSGIYDINQYYSCVYVDSTFKVHRFFINMANW